MPTPKAQPMPAWARQNTLRYKGPWHNCEVSNIGKRTNGYVNAKLKRQRFAVLVLQSSTNGTSTTALPCRDGKALALPGETARTTGNAPASASPLIVCLKELAEPECRHA